MSQQGATDHAEAICTGCGTAECGGCRSDYDTPRHCPRCGRLLRTKVHPAGWAAECRRCDLEIRSP